MMDAGVLEDHGGGNFMPVADPQRQEQLKSKRKVQKREHDEQQLSSSLQNIIDDDLNSDLDIE